MRFFALGIALAAVATFGANAYADGIGTDYRSVHAFRDPCWPLNRPADRGLDCISQGSGGAYNDTYPALSKEPYASIFDEFAPDSYDGRGSYSEDFTYFPGSGGYGVSRPFRRQQPVTAGSVWVETKADARRRLYSR